MSYPVHGQFLLGLSQFMYSLQLTEMRHRYMCYFSSGGGSSVGIEFSG